MASTLTTPASAKSIEYFKALYAERFGDELPATHYEGKSQSAVSGAIKRLLAFGDGNVEPTPEQKQRVIDLGVATGQVIVPGATLTAVNRQIRSLEAKVRRQEYHQGASDFDSFLNSLAPTADEANAPF